ncbi:MAG: hypothetical protein KAJ19_26165 [Gammaproteobacteria bacterium]|nr:hypothetical protein [Gammaproteobacteria bacterium]
MTVKNILVTNGTTGWTGQTRAATYLGYHNAAKRVWPHFGLFRGTVRMTDLKTGEVLFEEHMTFLKLNLKSVNPEKEGYGRPIINDR